jgi:Thiolase, N-terminal domain
MCVNAVQHGHFSMYLCLHAVRHARCSSYVKRCPLHSYNLVTYACLRSVLKLFHHAQAAMAAGIPYNVPGHTISQACISANQAICGGVEKVCACDCAGVAMSMCVPFSKSRCTALARQHCGTASLSTI